jgi:hypothetical protein
MLVRRSHSCIEQFDTVYLCVHIVLYLVFNSLGQYRTQDMVRDSSWPDIDHG